MFNMDWRYTKGRGIPLSNVPSIREDNGEQTLTVWHDCARPEAQSGAREHRARNSCFLGVSGKTSQRKLYLRWTLKAHAEKGNHYGLTVLKKYLICLTSLWWATIFSLFLSLSHFYINKNEGNSNPLQYSCLENSMDREIWWATVHGVTKSQTQLSN